jgi:hypothetical protein
MMETEYTVQRRMRHAAIVGAAMTGGAALVGYQGLAYYVAHVLTAPRRRKHPLDDYVMTPFETGADFEEISFPSFEW